MKRLLLSLVVLTCLASIAQAKGPYRYRPYFYSGNSNYARSQSMLDYDLLSHGGYGPGGVDYYLLRAPSAYGYNASPYSYGATGGYGGYSGNGNFGGYGGNGWGGGY